VPPGERLIDDLADAILDGSPIDWAAMESSSDGTAQLLVTQLRVLAAVAAFARGDHGRASIFAEASADGRSLGGGGRGLRA
jgi:hypothetical protein